MLRITFYKEVPQYLSLSRTELKKVVIDTNVNTINEAFEMAVKNGANPYKRIMYTQI